jgi:hypothetical protein
MVTGLLTQTSPIESKILEEKTTASAAARRVCRGSGRKAQNRPIANAFEIVRYSISIDLDYVSVHLANLN